MENLNVEKSKTGIQKLVKQALTHCQNIEFIEKGNNITYSNYAGNIVTRNPTWKRPRKKDFAYIVAYIMDEFNIEVSVS